MKKPRKNEPRQTIEKILHKFYKLTVWDAKTNKDLTQEEIDALEEEFFFYQFDTNLYEYDIEHENYRDISVLLPALQKVEKEYSEKYDKIELVPHYNIDGYHICTQIIGYRKETDDEYNARVKKLQNDYEKYKKEKEAKKDKKKKEKIVALKEQIQKLEEK